DAHDFAQLGLSEKVETLPHGVLIRPELFGHGFAHDRNLDRILAVGVAKFTTAYQRNAQRLKEIGRDVVQLRQGPAITRGFILSLGEHSARQSSTERKIGGDGCRRNPRRCLSSFDGGAKILLAAVFAVMQGSKVESEHKEISRLEPPDLPVVRSACCERTGPR